MKIRIAVSVVILGLVMLSSNAFSMDSPLDAQVHSKQASSQFMQHHKKQEKKYKKCKDKNPGSKNPSNEPENNFSLSSNSLYVVAQEQLSGVPNNKTWEHISVELAEPSDSLYIYVNTRYSKLISDVAVVTTESEFSPQLIFTSIDFTELSQKIHFDKIQVKACKDKFCRHQYKGSPQIVDVVISAAPNLDERKECEHQEGNIFIDCVDPTWLGASAWEILDENGITDYHYFDGDNDYLIQWEALETGEYGHDTVLDIRFGDNPANGTFRFHPAGMFQNPRQKIDLTEYADGAIEFDVRVLDWGSNTTGLVATTECGWPCTSGEISLGSPTLFEWTSFQLKIADIIEDTQDGEFDLSRIEIGFSIFPSWGDMHGVHFQLDNVRWVKNLQ